MIQFVTVDLQKIFSEELVGSELLHILQCTSIDPYGEPSTNCALVIRGCTFSDTFKFIIFTSIDTEHMLC
jgi:hypothetical protein